ncbi:MAG: hypothetical protein JWO36_4257 [Myxococcales bacterium]|nr:hypothetical protein [Myxococcales bacterium]
MRQSSVLALGLASALGACATTPPADDPPCSQVKNADTFVVGLDKAGANGALDFKMMSADPVPPARGDNTWVVQVSSMTSGVVGSPVTGASMSVTPFMPSHQHGSPLAVVVTPMADAGQYKLTPVNLWMPGVWETTLDVTASGSSPADNVMFRFCIE